ncbi:MAG: hypothetical protein V2A74_01145 [bacterium]
MPGPARNDDLLNPKSGGKFPSRFDLDAAYLRLRKEVRARSDGGDLHELLYALRDFFKQLFPMMSHEVLEGLLEVAAMQLWPCWQQESAQAAQSEENEQDH